MIAILWGPAGSTCGSRPDQLILSVLHVYSAESGATVSAIQPASSVADSLSLQWLTDGSGVCTNSSCGRGSTEVSIFNVAGKFLSVSSADWDNLSVTYNNLYLAVRPGAPYNARGPVQSVYRMTGKDVSMPAEINAELGKCSLAMVLSWSGNSRNASLLSDNGSRHWFMCFDKDHLAYSQAQVIPLPLVASPF